MGYSPHRVTYGFGGKCTVVQDEFALHASLLRNDRLFPALGDSLLRGELWQLSVKQPRATAGVVVGGLVERGIPKCEARCMKV